MNNAIPRAQSPLVDRAGHPTREWYSFFLSALEAADGDSNLEEQIRAIIARIAALEGSSPLNFQLLGLDSVIVTGTPQAGQVQINLDGDAGDPGGTYFYGTGPDGAKGWLLLGDAFVAEPDELTKDVEPDTGIITLGLADVPDSGVGTLQKTQFDAKGRKTGTSTATTDDLPEGSTNLYFQEAPINGKQYARKDAAWSEVDAISIQFPFYTTAGAFDPVPLTANKELPFFLTNGAQANIPMVTA